MEKIILPLALKQPVKFAEGLGQSAGWFFKGLDAKAEQFFYTLGVKGCLKKFIKRLYYKDALTWCDAKALGKGIAKHLPAFFEAMGEQGLHRFACQLKENQQMYSFFSGLQEVVGGKHPHYLLAKQKIT